MTDSHLVKTRSNGWIWWIVGIVAVALLLMFVLRGKGPLAPARAPGSAHSSWNAPAPTLPVQVA